MAMPMTSNPPMVRTHTTAMFRVALTLTALSVVALGSDWSIGASWSSGKTGATAEGADPLHVRIDQIVEADGVGGLAPLADDAEFVRRAYLDLTGVIPTSAQARAFLDDQSPTKRAQLIDSLLASPRHVQHMAAVFDVMLSERRTDARIPAAEWRKYLVASFQANKPWDQLAREILSADGADPALRPAVKFYLDRDGEPNVLTRDVSRVFFGMDLQCAQCHDHPLIDDYYQADYYGVFAFLTRSYVFTDKKDAKQVFFAEKADGEAKFASVFTKQAGQASPRVPGGEYLVEPSFNKGEEYNVAPADNVRPVPKYSRRAELAKHAASATNRPFSRNIANRLWAQMFGRGLVDPVDLHHAANPPSHPALMDLLTDEIAALKFDMRAFMREVALSRTYQRSLEPPAAVTEPAQAIAPQLATLEAEQKKLEAAAGELQSKMVEALKQREAGEKTLLPIHEEWEKVGAEANKALDASNKAKTALQTAQTAAAAKQDVSQVLTAAAAKTAEAAKKLPEDKELAGAAEKFQARATTLATELAAAQKAVEAATAPAKTAADALAAAQVKLNEAQAKLAAARGPVEALRKQFLEREAQHRAALYQASLAGARVLDAKALIDVQAKLAAVETARAAVTKAQANLQANKDTVARLAAELPKKQAELAEAQKARDEATKQLTEAQSQVATKQDIAKTLAEATAQAEAAKAKLPNDAELATAAGQVKAKADKAAADIAEAQKLVAAREPAVKAATDKMAAAAQVVTTMTNEMTAAQQQTAALEGLVKQASDAVPAAIAAANTARQDWVQRWSNRGFAAGLRPMTPEQLGLSILQTTGVLASYRVAAEAELAKAAPLTDAIKADPQQMAARAVQIEQSVTDKLAGSVAGFVSVFGGGPGQNQNEFFATVDQALFLANGGSLNGWLAPGGDNLTGRLVKLDNPQAIAEELYLSVFTRRPTAAETNDVAQYLANRAADKPVALQEMAWALITSAEFRFNH